MMGKGRRIDLINNAVGKKSVARKTQVVYFSNYA